MQLITIKYLCDLCLKEEKDTDAVIAYKSKDNHFGHACIFHEQHAIEFDLERWPVKEETIRESDFYVKTNIPEEST
jgi:hypothetical protein